jgi:hypothetical protein
MRIILGFRASGRLRSKGTGMMRIMRSVARLTPALTYHHTITSKQRGGGPGGGGNFQAADGGVQRIAKDRTRERPKRRLKKKTASQRRWKFGSGKIRRYCRRKVALREVTAAWYVMMDTLARVAAM